MSDHTLLGTADPMIWAEEFCRIFHGRQITALEGTMGGEVDAGLMVGWFANAMATALSLHNTEVDEAEEWETQEWTPADNEPDTDPTLEEQFREGFDEGRRED